MISFILLEISSASSGWHSDDSFAFTLYIILFLINIILENHAYRNYLFYTSCHSFRDNSIFLRIQFIPLILLIFIMEKLL